MRFNNQQPRYDMHYIVDFREASPDAELVVQVWDKDKHGGDDFISEVRLASIDVRRLCQRKSKFQDFKLQAAGANPSKKEKRLAAGALTIQFHDCAQYASPRDKEQGTFLYPGDMKFWRQEADKIDRPRRDKESEMAKKLAKAREDFAV